MTTGRRRRSPASVDLRTRLLSDLPAALPLVAAWQHGEWGGLEPGDTLERREERLRAHLDGAGLPLTMVALADGNPAGCAGLVAEELSDYADLTPWLSSVYVDPAWRGRGVGTALTLAVERKARDLGWSRLYLCTWTARSLYERLGWRPLRSFERGGRRIEIMVSGGPAAGI